MVGSAIQSVGLWDGMHAYTGSAWTCAYCGHSPSNEDECCGPIDDVDILAQTLVRLHQDYYIEVKISGGTMIYKLTHADGWITADGGDDLKDVLREAIKWEVEND